MTTNINKIYNDKHPSKHHKEVKRIMKKTLKILALNLEHLTSSYLLQSMVVEDSQIECDDHFKPNKPPLQKN
jgi:hypothetical protein